MRILETIKRLLNKLRGLDRLGTRELRHEKIRYEYWEQRAGREIDRLENLKQAMFLRGKNETGPGRLSLARKIKDLDTRSRAKDQERSLYQQQIAVLDGLLRIKERAELLRELRAGSCLASLPQEKATELVERATAQEWFERDKVIAMRESLDRALGQLPPGEPDKDLVAIVAAMEDAHAADEVGDPKGMAAAVRRIEAVFAREQQREFITVRDDTSEFG